MTERDVRGGYDCDHADSTIDGVCTICHERVSERDFKVGDIVTIKGQGEFILKENCNLNGDALPEDCVWRCNGHGPPNCSYWVRQKDIVGKATVELILARHKEAAARKLSCNSPDCWCRRYVP